MAKDITQEELIKLVSKLSRQVERLEKKVAEYEARRQPSDEELILIAAAAAAQLGVHGKIRSVHRVVPGSWVQQSRTNVHNRAVTR